MQENCLKIQEKRLKGALMTKAASFLKGKGRLMRCPVSKLKAQGGSTALSFSQGAVRLFLRPLRGGF